MGEERLQALLQESPAVATKTGAMKPGDLARVTALELQGYAHYLSQSTTVVHLCGPKAPPGWARKLPYAG